MQSSHTLLRRWYLSDNRKYFAGRLPLDTELVIRPLDTEHACAERLSPSKYRLSLDPAVLYFIKFARIQVRHEMVHIDHWEQGLNRIQHGKRFQQDMLRLAQMGAFKDLW